MLCVFFSAVRLQTVDRALQFFRGVRKRGFEPLDVDVAHLVRVLKKKRVVKNEPFP